MNAFTQSSLAGIVFSALLVNQVDAYLPAITFENPDYPAGSTLGTVAGTGWSLIEGAASVSAAGTGFGGGQALKLAANPNQEALLKRSVTWNPAEQIAFIDLRIKPAADPEGSYASFFANGTQLAFQVPAGGQTGEIWVYHGGDGTANPAQWAKTVGTFQLASGGLNAADFTRITLRHDYLRNVWDLFIDGKLAAANLAFEMRGENLTEIELYGSKIADTLVDDLAALTDNMLFPDADKDGLPDAWEIANGSNPNLYDRDVIKPGTGKSFLDHYMDSLWEGGLNGNAPLPPQGSVPPLTILGAHQPVGALKGSLSVGADGAASYTLPIDIPKGTAGMEPKISLNYSSNGGNGIAGVGWSIGGLQSVTRGSATVAKDGFAGTVNFDGNDRFSFNGERLVCVSGTYGQLGSEYRTEIDSFARITLMGGHQDHPASWWKVETKAGLIIELGNSPDSKIHAPTVNAPLVWDVSRVSDTSGNYYTIHWADTRTPDHLEIDNRRLSHIAYTGNSNTNQPPYCRIDFGYEARTDTSFAYSPHGTRMENDLRLSTITASTDNQANHTYLLQYDSSTQTSRSLLQAILKQQPDGSTTLPTVFTWAGLQPGQPKWSKAAATTIPKYHSFDAANTNLNSVVTGTGDFIRLDGHVSRAHTVPGGMQVPPDGFIEFDVRSDGLDNGAYLVIDSNTSWTYQTDFTIRIKPPGTVSAALIPKREATYSGGGAWETLRIPLQGGSFNLTPGNYPLLALINYDLTAENGTSSVEFRNIRIGTASQLDSGLPAPIQFPETADIPRFTANNGAQRGVRIMDINSDGLPDLVDARVSSPWTHASYELVPTASGTSGSVFINTGGGFAAHNSFLPAPKYPLSNNGTDGGWTTRFDMAAVPCDINGDGSLDLLVSELQYAPNPGTTSLQRYLFLTLQNGSWVEMTDYRPHFHSRTASSTAGGFWGWKHVTTKDLIDVDRDGYPDMVVETTPQGWLAHADSSGTPQLLPENSRTVFLNRVHLQQGWVQSDQLAPPVALRRSDSQNLHDLGSRFMDVDGDGFQDMLSASVEFPTAAAFAEARAAYRFSPPSSPGASGSWIGTGGVASDIGACWLPAAPCPPPGSSGYTTSSPFTLPNPVPLDGNAPLVSYPATQGKSSGTTLLDVNGDGLVDINRAFSRKFIYSYFFGRGTITSIRYERSHSTWFNTGRETAADSSRWSRDASDYGIGYNLPLSLVTESLGEDQSCHQFADLNVKSQIDTVSDCQIVTG